MITVKPLEDNEKTEQLFKENKLDYCENSICVAASDNGEIIGYCLCDIVNREMTVRFITPDTDIALADGILRSTLHVGFQRGMINAKYCEPAPEGLFKKLGFIKSESEKTLNSDKLFQSCCSCEKNSCKN